MDKEKNDFPVRTWVNPTIDSKVVSECPSNVIMYDDCLTKNPRDSLVNVEMPSELTHETLTLGMTGLKISMSKL